MQWSRPKFVVQAVVDRDLVLINSAVRRFSLRRYMARKDAVLHYVAVADKSNVCSCICRWECTLASLD